MIDMIDDITITNEDVRASQQAMIRTCERAGLNRKVLASLLGVEESYIRHIMADGTFFGSARTDRMLMAICSRIDQDHYVEALLPDEKYVETNADVETNNCYLDEVLDGHELLGKTTHEVRQTKDPFTLRELFGQWESIARRGKLEAVAEIRAQA